MRVSWWTGRRRKKRKNEQAVEACRAARDGPRTCSFAPAERGAGRRPRVSVETIAARAPFPHRINYKAMLAIISRGVVDGFHPSWRNGLQRREDIPAPDRRPSPASNAGLDLTGPGSGDFEAAQIDSPGFVFKLNAVSGR